MNERKQTKPLKPNQFGFRQGESAVKEAGKEKNTDNVLHGFYCSALCEDFLPKY